MKTKTSQADRSWTRQIQRARSEFEKHDGLLRTNEALKSGIHPRTLYLMRDRGIIESLSRGLYRLKDLPSGDTDFTIIAKKIPEGVLCLISALSIHNLTTQIPHEIYIALQKGARRPKIKHPPLRYFWFRSIPFKEGVEIVKIKNISVRVYSPEKTIADCFKFRNKIGLDIAIEALRTWNKKRKSSIDTLMHFAKICRVEKIILPYVETLNES